MDFLYAQHMQGSSRGSGAPSHRRRDVFETSQAQKTDGEVAQSGHDLRAILFSDLLSVLVVRHIAQIM